MSERFLSVCSPAGLVEALDELPIFVLVLDQARKIVFWNRKLEVVTGVSRNDALGSDGALFATETGERRLPVKGGGYRDVRWLFANAPSSNGATLSYGLGADVTTERLTLQRTLQAERAAASGTVAAGVAHEIRNPLNAAILQLDVLEGRLERGHSDLDSLLAVLSTVREEMRRIDNAIVACLDLVPTRRPEMRRVDLNELLSGLIADKQADVAPSSTAVALELDPGVGKVELDPSLIQRAIAGLLDNAIEASPDGFRVWVRTLMERWSGYVSVEIEDAGPGFVETAPLFDPFFTTKQGRLGLGLSIAQRIALDHGGTLEGSTLTGRTCFRLRLPLTS